MSDERQQAPCLPVSISEKAEQAERRKNPLFERLSCAMPSTGRIENIGAIIGALVQLLTASRQFVQSLSWLGDAIQALPTKVVVVERVRDPVCGKRVDPHTTRLTIEHQGESSFSVQNSVAIYSQKGLHRRNDCVSQLGSLHLCDRLRCGIQYL